MWSANGSYRPQLDKLLEVIGDELRDVVRNDLWIGLRELLSGTPQNARSFSVIAWRNSQRVMKWLQLTMMLHM
ncbi:MAG: hypothetical protein HGA22_04840 [Clostridiales bacterium]|nr:hypothetical protein [Clostridiales bacterium]